MSEMTTTEILERYNEGLKKASARAREMFSVTENKMWLDIAVSLDGIRVNGEKMARGKALTEKQVLDILDAKKAEKIMKETRH